jgi:hypothetical protein
VGSDVRLDAVRNFRHAFAPEDLARLPNYAALAEAFSESPVAVDLMVAVPAKQANPMLLFAVLHYLALRGHPVLAPLYGSLARPHDFTPAEFAATVVEVLSSETGLVASQMHRTTQTNEVGRSAVLRAVLRELRRRGVTDLNLVDVGCSAGLNLYLDYYPVSQVPVDDALTLVCEELNDNDSPGELPTLHQRIGIDLNPLDLRDEDNALWLRSCLWPEDPSRLARLALIEQLMVSWPPTTLLRGSVLDRLDDALALAEPNVPTLVLHTWAAAYFPEEIAEAFARRMRELAASSLVYWLAIEWPRGVPALHFPEPRTPEPRPGACQIVVTAPGDQSRDWGWCHAHGRWLALSFSDGPKA